VRREQLAQRYGPWVVVTGASSGIGRGMAQELAALGLNTVLVARGEEALRDLATELHEAYGIESRVIAADLADLAEAKRVVDETIDLDIGLLVANAGYGTSGEFLDSELDIELNMLAVNCLAVTVLTHSFGNRFKERGSGGVVLMSSISAFQGIARQANYAASKAYVQSFGEGLRAELQPLGIEVLIAAPGPVESGFAARADMQVDNAASAETVASGIIGALGKNSTVRPGFQSKLLGYGLSTAPRRMRTRILSGVIGGFTKHQVTSG